jgi:ADP-L-glycero-D-manno-heptose 6-epimerase
MTYSGQNFNKKTILITGGAGFIGSNLAFYFQNNYPQSNIVIFDCFRDESKLSNGNLKSFGHFKNLIDFHGDIICGDINNYSDLERLNDYKFDYIFHLAAISDTRAENQKLLIQTNVNSFYDILKITERDKSSLVYASSAATYGNSTSPQVVGKENPENTYGYSKYVMDQIALRASNQNPNLSIIGLRYFNVYGPREFYKGKTASMVIQLGHQILSGQSLKLFEGSDKILRDFIFIDDVTQANIRACISQKSGVFNVGTGQPRSFQDIANILQKEFNTDSKVEYILNPYQNYQRHTQADIKSTIDYLGFDPLVSLDEGIHKYISEIKQLYVQPNS